LVFALLPQLLDLIIEALLAILQLLFHHLEVSNLLVQLHELLPLLSLLLLVFDDLLKSSDFLLRQVKLWLVFPGKSVDVAVHDLDAGVAQVV